MSSDFWTTISRDNRIAFVNCAETYWAIRSRGQLWVIQHAETYEIMADKLTTREVTAWRPARPVCPYCSDGKYTGLPGGACENCMNTGYADVGPDDL